MTSSDTLFITEHDQKLSDGVVNSNIPHPNYWFCISVLLEGYFYNGNSYTVQQNTIYIKT